MRYVSNVNDYRNGDEVESEIAMAIAMTERSKSEETRKRRKNIEFEVESRAIYIHIGAERHDFIGVACYLQWLNATTAYWSQLQNIVDRLRLSLAEAELR